LVATSTTIVCSSGFGVQAARCEITSRALTRPAAHESYIGLVLVNAAQIVVTQEA
jgi:hypothetical protein